MFEEIKDVSASVWISASAGTGKTKCLIDRILALLLNGVQPSKILCLTYTKAAASEMLSRLSSYTKKLHEMSEHELIDELETLGFEKHYCKIAKELYGNNINSSSWVQIKTIHSFCFSILEKFPLETGLLPGARLCDTYQSKKLLSEAINKVISDHNCYDFLTCLSQYTTNITELFEANAMKLASFFSKRNDFSGIYCDFFGISEATLNMNEEEINSQLLAGVFEGKHREIFTNFSNILAQGSPEDVKKSEILRKCASNNSADFIEVFLTEKGSARARMCSKKISDKYSDFPNDMKNLVNNVMEFCEQKKKIISAKANVAFFSVSREILFNYNKLKQESHFLDFNDVITISSTLLKNIEWAMYRVDEELEHILVDEAQDTSLEQWEIIKTISDEFFSQSQSTRTVFVVGDEKQSIYSFQGADTYLFNQMHGYFKRRSLACGQRFHDLVLNKSYRSTENILSFVDDVFRGIFPGVNHTSNRKTGAGVVEVVDLFCDADEQNQSRSEDIHNQCPQASASKKMANYIAISIRNAIKNGVFVESKNRSAKASDFLVLFQRRDVKSMCSIINALRDVGVSVSGVDRVLLKDELIVEDLITFAEFSVSPNDDLACARVLKSPIVGFSEEDLMKACLDRKEEHLWNYLLNNNELYEKHSLHKLKSYVSMAFQLPAFDFFSYALTDGIKERYINALGEKCLEILWEFLDIVISYEKENNASLQDFLRWFTSFEHEIKRENFSAQDCVRLMTVHASKGLQAPFVILADCHFLNSNETKIISSHDGLLLWDFSREFRPMAVESIHKKYSEFDSEESARLLYVAMTRAQDFLYIFGEQKSKKIHDNCWYNIVKNNICTENFNKIVENGVQLLRMGNYLYKDKKKNFEILTQSEIKQSEIPIWFLEKVEHGYVPVKQEEIKNPGAIYGEMVHLLLNKMQSYVHLSEDDFFDMGDIFLLHFEEHEKVKKAAMAECYNLLHNSDLSFLFAENSLSEYSFVFETNVGRIDKVAFKGDDIWIVDFKTGLPQNELLEGFLKQLCFYKKALEKIVDDDKSKFMKNGPTKNIRTAILWTSTAEMVEFSVNNPSDFHEIMGTKYQNYSDSKS